MNKPPGKLGTTRLLFLFRVKLDQIVHCLLFDNLLVGIQHTRMCHQGGLNIAVPVREFLVPFDRRLESLFPRHCFRPSQLVQLARVDGVAQVIELSVRHERNQLVFFGFLAKDFQQSLGHTNIWNFVLSPNIVHVSRCSLVHDDIKGSGNIRHVQKVARVGAVAVNGERQAFHQLIRKLGDELFRKLVRAVDIVASRNETRQLKAAKVGLDEKLGSRLGGGVGVGRFQDVVLRHWVRIKVFAFAVDFIGRNVHEPLERAAGLGRLQQDVRAVYVRLRER